MSRIKKLTDAILTGTDKFEKVELAPLPFLGPACSPRMLLRSRFLAMS